MIKGSEVLQSIPLDVYLTLERARRFRPAHDHATKGSLSRNPERKRDPKRKIELIEITHHKSQVERKAASSHIQEAMSGESIDITPEEVKQEPIVWAGVYPQYLICIVATEGVLVFDELVPQPRQVGQGLSFG